MAENEKIASKTYYCKYCGKEFNDKRKLAGHVTYCPQNPKLKEHLENLNEARKNIKRHECNGNYVCQYCGKIISNAVQIEKNVQIVRVMVEVLKGIMLGTKALR